MSQMLREDYILIVYSDIGGWGRVLKEHLEASSSLEVIAIDYENPVPFRLDVLEDGSWTLEIDGRKLGPPAAAWFRWKTQTPSRIATPADVSQRLRITEWSAFLTGLSLLLGARLLNGYNWASTHKIWQQQQASLAGFRVPRSAYFAGKDQALKIAGELGPVVVKALGNPNITRLDHELLERDLIATTSVEPAWLDEADESEFLASPLWFQEKLRHGHELRIIVFDEEIFPARIVAELENFADVDSRLTQREFEVTEIDDELRNTILRFMRLVRLDYGVFDIICSDGQYSFLECNPEGQWESGVPFGFDTFLSAAERMVTKRARDILAGSV
jgi:hypothetical protein